MSESDRPHWQAIVAVAVTGWLVCFIVVGPIVEELYFRGLVVSVLAHVLVNAMAFVALAAGTLQRLSGWTTTSRSA